MKSIIYIVLLLIGGMAPIRAQPTYQVEPDKNRPLDGFISHYDDTTAQLGIGQIQAMQNQFRPLPGSQLNQGYTPSHHWLHIRLHTGTPQTVFIEFDNSRINQFWFYQVQAGQLVQQVVTGDSLPFETRAFLHYNWVFPITLNKQTPTDVYVMVAKRYEVLGVRAHVWDARTFEQKDRSNYLFWGMLAGIGLLILLINVIALIGTREVIYFWFINVILAVAFHILAQSGLGFQYVWTEWPAFNRYDPPLMSAWLIILAQVHFVQHFIGQKREQSLSYWAVTVFKGCLIILLFLNVALRYADVFPKQHFQWTFTMTLVFMVVSILLAFLYIYERIRQREPIIIFFTITISIQLVGYLLVFFVNLAFINGGKPLFKIDSYVVVIINFLFDLIVFTLGILYFWFQRSRQKHEQLLTTLHQYEQAQSEKVIEALEIERNRIAEDLYDDVGAMLSTAIGFVSSVMRKPDVREKFPLLTEARQLLVRAVDNLRTVSHNLMPKNFAELGLAKSLAETIDKVSASTDIRFRFIVVGPERRLDVSTEVQIFRIAVELINDIVKNSDATEATFQLVYGKESLMMIAEDDGPNPPQYNNLHSKVAFINGKIDADISPSGVTVMAEIPY